jgi:hypothetical protein
MKKLRKGKSMYKIYKPNLPYRRKYSTQRRSLNVHKLRVQELSQKYNIAPKVVAYIRAAMNQGRYNKNSLILHIQRENVIRHQAIEEHKVSTRFSEEEKARLIEYTTININFRERVIEILNRLGELQITDILN